MEWDCHLGVVWCHIVPRGSTSTHAPPNPHPNPTQYFLLVPFLAAAYRSGQPGLRKFAKWFTWACLLSCCVTSWVLTIKVFNV
jgi:hypothetical protein